MKQYTMSDDEYAEIIAACRPTPVMFLSGGIPMGPSQQENANAAWAKLGKKHGFDPMSVRQAGGSDKIFLAEPVTDGGAAHPADTV